MSRPSDRPPLIEAPGRERQVRRILALLASAGLWVLWAWLTWPFLAALAYFVGEPDLHAALAVRHGDEVFLEILGDLRWCALFLAFHALWLALWVVHNVRRFAGKVQRRNSSSVHAADVSRHFGLSDNDLEILQEGRIVELLHHEDGTISRLVVRTPTPLAGQG